MGHLLCTDGILQCGILVFGEITTLDIKVEVNKLREMRLIRKIPVALLTFLLGVTISQLWSVWTTVESPPPTTRNSSVDQSQPVRVSVCDLLNEPALYRNRRLKLEGVLYSTDTALLVYENCSNVKDQVPVIAIGFQEISDQVARLLEDLDGLRQPWKMEVNVRVIGEIDQSYTVDDDPYLHIVVEEFELLSPLRRFRLSGAA